MLQTVAALGEGLDTLDLNWMTGAENRPGCWTLRTERLTPGRARRFDSYDRFPSPRGRSTGGDGGDAKITLDDRQLWPDNGWQYCPTMDDRPGYDVRIDVAEGDRVRFVVGKHGTIAYDTTEFDPTIAYEDGRTHVASREFRGSQGRHGWRYGYIEKGEWHDLVYYPEAKAWRLKPDNATHTPFVMAALQHPHVEQDVVRQWTAPRAGRVRITGSVCNVGDAGLGESGSPGRHRMASSSYAPWYALYDRKTQDGLIIGWDYMGHWASDFTAADDGTVRLSLRVAGHRQSLAPGESVTTPWAFTAVFREDLDNAGNELLDIYHYLAAHGVVGRWVRVYRPRIGGDEPTMYFQRLSRDGRRGLIIPKRPAPRAVTIRPKGLLPELPYLVTFHESSAEQTRSGSHLMQRGITLQRMRPGELIYLNLPLHPGSRRDRDRPGPPRDVLKRLGENMGYPGVELSWKAGSDDNWVSYYQVLRDGRAIDKVAKGTFYFDHSAGADLAAKYEVQTVDGSGNASPLSAARGPAAHRSQVFDDTDARLKYIGRWRRETNLQPAHQQTIIRSNHKGAAVEVPFEGKRVLWFSKLGDDCGKAAVSVDGDPAQQVDTYWSDDVWGVCVYRRQLPTGGRHVLRIEVAGERNPRAKDCHVHVDGIRAEF